MAWTLEPEEDAPMTDLPVDPFVIDGAPITTGGRLACIEVKPSADQMQRYFELQRRLTSIRHQMSTDFGIPQEPFDDLIKELLERARDAQAPGSRGARAWLSLWAERRELVRSAPSKFDALHRLIPSIADSVRCLVLAHSAEQTSHCLEVLSPELGSRVTVDQSQTEPGAVIVGSPETIDLSIEDPELMIIVDPMAWASLLDPFARAMPTAREDERQRRVVAIVCRASGLDALEEGVDPVVNLVTQYLHVFERFDLDDSAETIRRFCAPFPEGDQLVDTTEDSWSLMLFVQEIRALLDEHRADYDEFIQRTSVRSKPMTWTAPFWYRSSWLWMPHYFEQFVVALNLEQVVRSTRGIEGEHHVDPSELRNLAAEWVRRWDHLLQLGLECRRMDVPKGWIPIADALGELCAEIVEQGHDCLLRFSATTEAQIRDFRSGATKEIELVLAVLPNGPPKELLKELAERIETAVRLGEIEILGQPPAPDHEGGHVDPGSGYVIVDLDGVELLDPSEYSTDLGRYDGSSLLILRDAILTAYEPFEDAYSEYRRSIVLPSEPIIGDPKSWVIENSRHLDQILTGVTAARQGSDLVKMLGIDLPKADVKAIHRLADEVGALYGRLLEWILRTRAKEAPSPWQEVVWAQADLGVGTLENLRNLYVSAKYEVPFGVEQLQLGRSEYVDFSFNVSVDLDEDRGDHFQHVFGRAVSAD